MNFNFLPAHIHVSKQYAIKKWHVEGERIMVFWQSRPDGTYPPNDPSRFLASVRTTGMLTAEGERFLEKVRTDESFARALRGAAQLNDRRTVEALIKQTGMTADFTVSYSPTSFQITLFPKNDAGCGSVVYRLCW